MVYHATPRCADVGRRGLNARESALLDEEKRESEGVGKVYVTRTRERARGSEWKNEVENCERRRR